MQTSNCLTEYIERVQYGCSKYKALSKKSLLNLIPEIYAEKNESDVYCERFGKKKYFMHDFVFKYITEKFRLKKIIKKNLEEILLGIIKYTNEDSRIDLFRRFLWFGENKIRREVLDLILIIYRNLPIHFEKYFYDEDYRNMLMPTEMCLEQMKNPQLILFRLSDEILPLITRNSIVYDSSNNEILKVADDFKYDYFLLTFFYSLKIAIN